MHPCSRGLVLRAQIIFALFGLTAAFTTLVAPFSSRQLFRHKASIKGAAWSKFNPSPVGSQAMDTTPKESQVAASAADSTDKKPAKSKTKQIEPRPTPSVAAKVCVCVPCDEPTRARTSARMLCWRRARGGRGCSTVQRDGVCWLWGARAACAADGTRLGLYGT